MTGLVTGVEFSEGNMPQHHLKALSQGLIQKGWKIVATRSLDEFPYDSNAWTIERGSAKMEIHFDRFGGMGDDLPLLESYGCSVAGRDTISLYFSKPSKRWNDDLAAFIAALDEVTA